jgi:hypothetical protein
MRCNLRCQQHNVAVLAKYLLSFIVPRVNCSNQAEAHGSTPGVPLIRLHGRCMYCCIHTTSDAGKGLARVCKGKSSKQVQMCGVLGMQCQRLLALKAQV